MMVPALNKKKSSVCNSLSFPRRRESSSLLIITLSIILITAATSCKKQSEPADPPDIFATPKNSALPTEIIHLAGKPFTIELAFKSASRHRGLMFRSELPLDTGMLFVFERSQPRSFYMKNCLIDLDLIWITDDHRIAQITTMTVPVPGKPLKFYHSPVPVKYALELPAGTCQTIGLKTGQKITFPPRIQRILPDPN